MPLANVRDAREVERRWPAIRSAPDADTAAPAIRARFVEILDFDYADQPVPLNSAAPNLPSDARLLARRDRDQPKRAGGQQIANLRRRRCFSVRRSAGIAMI